MNEKRKRRMLQKKRKPEKGSVPMQETDDDWYFDEADVEMPEDPYDARLPALVLEMRKEHEEVVGPKGWILFTILCYVPVIGTAVLFLAGYGKKGNPGKNLRNFAKAASFASLAYTACLFGVSMLLVTHGHQIRQILLSLKGV